MERAVTAGAPIRKVFGWADMYYRQRYYMSNNFLQHAGLAEAIVPFYNWDALLCKFSNEYSLFSSEIYRRIFSKHFPALASVPHPSDIQRSKVPPVARWTKRRARQLFGRISSKRWLSLLAKSRCRVLTMAALVGDRRVEEAILAFDRLYLLEQRTRSAGMSLDWDSL
jgi:hypothetical protein